MSLIVGVIILAVVVALVVAVVVYLTFGSSSGAAPGASGGATSNLRALVVSQRVQPGQEEAPNRNKVNLAMAAAAESQLSRKKTAATSRMTMLKKLKYARWPITPVQFRIIQVLTAIVLFIPAYLHATVFIMILAVLAGLFFCESVLDYSVQRRFNLFDEDYPVMLLQYVSLLKTGMTAIGGLEAAGKALEEGSLVREEIELLIERLRLGLTEEQAINAFGDDIPHPELELFVQSLLLSRRVGGTLSATLERLAKAVRKRQQFRKQAIAAVGMERGSLYLIAVIMSLLMGYLAWQAPELVFPAFKNPTGSKIFQFGLLIISVGFYWMSRVTKIKI